MKRVASLTFAAAVAACGGSPSSPDTSQTTAVIALSASPSTAAGGPCTGCGAQSTDREVATDVTVRETGGVAATVTSVAMTLRDSATGSVIASGAFDTDGAIVSLAGSSRLPANGSLVLRAVGVHYPREQAGKGAALTITVTVRDDRGHTLGRDLIVPVTST